MTHTLNDQRPRLALFDLDHTLLPLDSDYEWGQFTARKGLVHSESFAQRNAEFFAQYRAGTLDLNEYVQFATEAVRKLGPQASHAARECFMAEVITPAILPQALDLIAKHRDAGDTLVIVTATNEFVTGPIAQALGITHLLAVNLERDASGWYTGRIAGTPTSREGKVTRMTQWLTERGWDWDSVHTTFYSDSSNDLALLEQANVAIATNPDDFLRQQAQQRGWAILDLFPQA
ncbi:HAD family hydrolase [Lampropedia puyangensis]|uniref:HAD family hydrolase n=1 Tax=Lampropedia puyangensis TaxID=1330072 RepID=A0A4S8FCY9_9BURK|nr:HAD family hydrolase [Lampropedia puyangensis]THU05390.1 HAD family hydrolase [Lampropedia puyangensis]